MRVLGIDHGQRRIGLALSDPTGTIAQPLAVLERRFKRKRDLLAIAKIAREHGAEAIVIGIPLDPDGTTGKKAREVMQFAQALQEVVRVPVHQWDERMTTAMAEDSLVEAGVGWERRKELIDQVAAALILQGWLDENPRGGADAP